MNNNFYEIPGDWYSEFNANYMNPVNTTNNNLTNPRIALDRGNLFNNLYDPYRNYRYRELKASNKKEELLLNILNYNFALVELGLYLDLNPLDRNMLNIYNQYLDNKKKLCDEYEKSYGPLSLEGLNMGNNDWHYLNLPWPWEGTK